MQKQKYNLKKALFDLLQKKQKDKEAKYKLYIEILSQTGLTEEEFSFLALQDQTIGNLYYRIINLLNKKKIDTTHLI